MAPVVSRRHVMKLGLASTGAPALAHALGVSAAAQDVGPAKGKLGVSFNQTRNDEEMVARAIEDLFHKSYDAISKSLEIRKFVPSP